MRTFRQVRLVAVALAAVSLTLAGGARAATAGPAAEVAGDGSSRGRWLAPGAVPGCAQLVASGAMAHQAPMPVDSLAAGVGSRAPMPIARSAGCAPR